MSTGTTTSPSTRAHERRPIVVDERTARPRVLTADRLPLEGSGLATWIVLALLGAAVVAEAGLRLHASAVDLPLTVALNDHRTGLLGALTTGLYRYLEPQYAAVLAVAVVGLVAWRRGLRVAAVVAVTAAGSWMPVVIIKALVARPRPDTALLAHPMAMTPGDWSFPSGHTAFVAALGVALVLASLDTAAARWAPWAALAAVLTMGGSVLVDGVHYPSDVRASIVWVLSVAPLLWVLSARLSARVPFLAAARPVAPRR